jgi:hypothetical protein
MPYLLNTLCSKLCGGFEQCRRFPPLNVSPDAVRYFAKAQKSLFVLNSQFIFYEKNRLAGRGNNGPSMHRYSRRKARIARPNTQGRHGLWKRLGPAEFEERGFDTS